jgi:hypothetical protein
MKPVRFISLGRNWDEKDMPSTFSWVDFADEDREKMAVIAVSTAGDCSVGAILKIFKDNRGNLHTRFDEPR